MGANSIDSSGSRAASVAGHAATAGVTGAAVSVLTSTVVAVSSVSPLYSLTAPVTCTYWPICAVTPAW